MGRGVGTEAALAAVCECLDEWVDADRDRVLGEFRKRDALRGGEIGWVGAGGAAEDGSGVADGIDDRGNLVVVSSEGERLSLGSGEVTLRLKPID
jgi:biotin-(acetyl-CoA carboxylase) ligase